MPYAHSMNKPLNESVSEAINLCDNIEKCLFYGIRIPDFFGTIPFWGLIQRLDAGIHTCNPLRHSIAVISNATQLKTPWMKARAWIRFMLNEQALDEALEYMRSKPFNYLRRYFDSHSLMTTPNDVGVFLAILRPLKVLTFSFAIDSADLFTTSSWVGRPNSLGKPLLTDKRVRDAVSANSTTGSDSILNMFQRDVMDVFSTATKVLLSESEGPPGGPGLSIPHSPTSNDVAQDMLFIEAKLYNEVASNTSSRQPLFGTNLQDLVTDYTRCFYAHLEPKLGIPNQISKLIYYLSTKLNTPGLFRKKSKPESVMKLRRFLEREKGIPKKGIDAHVVAQCLIIYLYELPEPLLGYQHYDAILSCHQTLEDKVELNRNMSLLVQESPWYCMPLLTKMISLLKDCLHPSHSDLNGLTITTVSVIAAPFLFRRNDATWKSVNDVNTQERYVRNRKTLEQFNKMLTVAAVTGSAVVEYLLLNEVEVFKNVRGRLTMMHSYLKEKCLRIRHIQELVRIKLPSDILSIISTDKDGSNNIFISEMEELWRRLEIVEKRRKTSVNETLSDPIIETQNPMIELRQKTFKDILSSDRWEICGFPKSNPSQYFGPYPIIFIKCLCHSLTQYEGRVSGILAESVQKRSRYFSISQMVSSLVELTLQTLGLTETSPSTRPPLQVISRLKSWDLFSENDIYQVRYLIVYRIFDLYTICVDIKEIFVMSLLTFDENWKKLTDRVHQMPDSATFNISLHQTKDAVKEIIFQHPRTLIELWEYWTKYRVRIQLQEEFKDDPYSPALSNTKFSLLSAKLSSPTSTNLKARRKKSISKGGNSSPAKNIVSNAAGKDRLFDTDYSIEIDPDFEIVIAESTCSPDPYSPHQGTAPSSTTDLQELNYHYTSTDNYKYDQVQADQNIAFVNKDPTQNRANKPQTNLASNTSNISKSSRNGKEDIFTRRIEENALYFYKCFSGIETKVIGKSSILSQDQIDQIESGLPRTYQCQDWKLLYRLTRDGSSLTTLIRKSRPLDTFLFVVKDSNEAIFGALITEKLLVEGDKYYGGGTTCVWTFKSGIFHLYQSANKNSYYMLTSQNMIGFGGGGNFALYLDGDLNKGSSGSCETFDSPCLSSTSPFTCIDCELFSIQSPF